MTLELDFDKQGGLVPAIVQDATDGTVLMVAYMNGEALAKTIETGRATYWSRSRATLWVKGESSGNVQEVEEVLVRVRDLQHAWAIARRTRLTKNPRTQRSFTDCAACSPRWPA